MIRPMKYKVFFYDSIDINTGVFISLEEAVREDYVQLVNDEIVPFDECSLIYEYGGLFNKFVASHDIEQITGQVFSSHSYDALL